MLEHVFLPVTSFPSNDMSITSCVNATSNFAGGVHICMLACSLENRVYVMPQVILPLRIDAEYFENMSVCLWITREFVNTIDCLDT